MMEAQASLNVQDLIEPLVNSMGETLGFVAHCPGCDSLHVIWTNSHDYPKWDFNGDLKKPTFSPSLLLRAPYHGDPKKRRCHAFIRNGQWLYLADCTHGLAGETVNMLPVEADE
ncbi:hypothetical protein P886_3804 [Alteromonadaceae bacterium 2753L.S.0a.02]|nr:hypothetical protein P886_3804 [Alteromonadaceae bacterium 2753L.S.0a.02]